MSFWHEKISESLKRCGISENSTYILVARFAASADEVRWRNQSLFANFCFWHSLSKASCYLVWICHLFHQMVAIEKLIKGKEIDLEEMERKADKPQIQKVHQFFFSDKEFDLLCLLRSCELMIYYGWIFVSSALQNISCRARNIFSWWCNSVQDCFSRCTLKLDVKVFIVFFNLNNLVSMFIICTFAVQVIEIGLRYSKLQVSLMPSFSISNIFSPYYIFVVSLTLFLRLQRIVRDIR